jgi:hypothetical protein
MHTRLVLQGHVAGAAMHVLSLSELPGLRPFNAPAAAPVHVPEKRRAAQQEHSADAAFLSAPAASATTTSATSCAAGATLPPGAASPVTQAPSSPPSTAAVDAAPASTALLQAANACPPDAHAASSAAAAALQSPPAAETAGTPTHALPQPVEAASVPSGPLFEFGTAPSGDHQPAALAGNVTGSTAAHPPVSPGVRHDLPTFTAGSGTAPAMAPVDTSRGAPRRPYSTAHAVTASGTGALPDTFAAGAPTQQQPQQPPMLPPEPPAGSAADLDTVALQDMLSQLRMENAMLKVRHCRPVHCC